MHAAQPMLIVFSLKINKKNKKKKKGINNVIIVFFYRSTMSITYYFPS